MAYNILTRMVKYKVQKKRLTIHFVGINGKGVSSVFRFFVKLNKVLGNPHFEFTASDVVPIKDSNIKQKVKGFIRDLKSSSLEFETFFNKHKPTIIVTTPAALNRKNKQIATARKLKIPIFEFSDIIRFLRDVFIEDEFPNPNEYSIYDPKDLTKLKYIFDQSVIKPKIILNTIKKTKLLPFYFVKPYPFKLYGVTGTDGKTTTCNIIYHIFKSLNIPVGMITTVGVTYFDGKKETNFETGPHATTPDTDELLNYLSIAQKLKLKHLVLEVSSHALIQMRLAGLKFDRVVITNLSKEHLDFHKTALRYHYAKSLIVTRHLKEDGYLITSPKVLQRVIDINYFVKRYNTLLTKASTYDPANEPITSEIFLYSHIQERKILEQKDKLTSRINFRVIVPQYKISQNTHINAISRFFVKNANFGLTSVLSVLPRQKTLHQRAITSLKSFKLPIGREHIVKMHPLIIVDFAHTPYGLKHFLREIKSFRDESDYNRIIIVFGTAGSRDQGKRPGMGRVAYKYADIIVLTAEDPRRENLFEINQQILSAMITAKRNKKVLEEHPTYHLYDIGGKFVYNFFEQSPKSREDAIKKAIEIAKPNDIVLITGKGHEHTLAFVTKTGEIKEYPWDDIKVAQKYALECKN